MYPVRASSLKIFQTKFRFITRQQTVDRLKKATKTMRTTEIRAVSRYRYKNIGHSSILTFVGHRGGPAHSRRPFKVIAFTRSAGQLLLGFLLLILIQSYLIYCFITIVSKKKGSPVGGIAFYLSGTVSSYINNNIYSDWIWIDWTFFKA